jgi:hypothetical protein
MWKTTGEFSIEKDSVLKKNILIASKKGTFAIETKEKIAGPLEINAMIRLRTDPQPYASATIRVGKKDASDQGFRMVLYTANNPSYKDMVTCNLYQGNGYLHDINALAKSMDWVPPYTNTYYYHLKAYREFYPGWPEDFRTLIEKDMTELQGTNEKWLLVRVELKDGLIRFWLDDRCISEKKDASIHAEGFAGIELSPGTEVAECSIKKTADEPFPFMPIRLTGYANGKEFLGKAYVKPDSLKYGGTIVVNGIPFYISGPSSEGKDHLDISKSLFRHANMAGYFPTYDQIFGGTAFRDPARIQIRIPNRQFDAIYVLAASDGRKDSIPRVSAMFFRPSAGFAETFSAKVPLATSRSADARPFPVTLSNGRKVNLWLVKIPLDPGKLSSFSDLEIVEVEFTKDVYQYRSYPDPIMYGWHQGGQPSSVHIYAVTLAEMPVGFTFEPDRFGHVWTEPEIPSYTATVSNHSSSSISGTVLVTTKSYDKTEAKVVEKTFTVPAGGTEKINFQIPVKLHGYHDVVASLSFADKIWTEKRSMVLLAPDTRSPRWTEGKGTLFGYWSYHGGHHTPKPEHIVRLMTLAGARTSFSANKEMFENEYVKNHCTRLPAGAWEVSGQQWAREEKYDQAKYEQYQQDVIKAYTSARNAIPEEFRPDHVYFFPEPSVSMRLTSGNYPEYWHGEPYQYTEEEKENLRMYFTTAKCAAEAIRKTWPNLKILIAWGDPLFPVPLLRAGFPKELIDGTGLDICGFERLPEQQLHQISLHRLYQLRKEYEKAGISDPLLYHCEGIFVPTEVGACTWREQMDIYNRWALLCMAYGVKRFYSGWFAFDCGNYYGAEHYGGCGIQRRIPYCDPKPAYAAYATMTDKLNEANYDGWLPTGSLSTYCLRFKGPKGTVYALWTVRGKRPVTLTLAADADVNVTDAMNNTKVVSSHNRKVTVMTDSSVVYVTGAGEIVSVVAGEPDNSDAQPAKGSVQVADLGDGTWKYTSERHLVYEKNNFDTFRYPGKFSSEIVKDEKYGKVLVSKLEKQDTVHELMPWYNILRPKRPITLPYAPSAIGLWVKGASDWGRVVYILRDAKGEEWISVGTKDQWNCDDVHSWSSFNFDGWRYVRFELPGHAGYDSFRKYGTTWWRPVGDGDSIVDLPLKLEGIIVEQRTHVLYVNDIQPVSSDTVYFGKMYVEYDTPEDASPEAVRISRLRMPMPKEKVVLPNPVSEMEKTGVGAATEIIKLEPPQWGADGTNVHVFFKEVEGAQAYYVWVSAHPDGSGAVNLTPSGIKNGGLVYGLRPGIKLYFWVTYKDAKGQMSKPSKVHQEILVDMFKEK